MALIDTNVLITVERRGLSISALTAGLEPAEVIAVSTVTISELMVGAHLAARDDQRTVKLLSKTSSEQQQYWTSTWSRLGYTRRSGRI